MNDEHDMVAASLHSASADDNVVPPEETQRRLDLRPSAVVHPMPPATNGDFSEDKYIAYTIKLPAHQLAALQSIWLELKRLYGAHSPDKSGMIQHAVEEWLKRWDGPDRDALLNSLLQIRADTRRRQYKK